VVREGESVMGKLGEVSNWTFSVYERRDWRILGPNEEVTLKNLWPK